jgi:tight adherence protein B
LKILLIGVIAFTAVAVLEALAHTMRFLSDKKRDELKRRLSALGSSDSGGAVVSGLLRRGKLSGSPGMDAFLRSVRLSARLEALLEQTELEMTVAQLLAMCLAGVVLGLLVGFIADAGFMIFVLMALFGFCPIFFVMWKRTQRTNRLSEQLPDALEMMARSLRAGHALSSSFKMVAVEMPTPVSIEFGRAFEAQELGLPFERAVADMTRRAPSNQDLKIFALSVIVQKETGGNLVEIIEKIADTVRQRYKFQGKLRGLTAEGRMSAYVVGGLPFFSLGFMMTCNRAYVMPLFRTQVGHYVLGFAVVMWTLGFTIIKKMTKVKI